MLKSAGASFGFYCHQSSERGLIAMMQYASNRPKIQVITIKPNIILLIFAILAQGTAEAPCLLAFAVISSQSQEFVA
jgi:hypothetical protein